MVEERDKEMNELAAADSLRYCTRCGRAVSENVTRVANALGSSEVWCPECTRLAVCGGPWWIRLGGGGQL